MSFEIIDNTFQVIVLGLRWRSSPLSSPSGAAAAPA